jgi:hypothetical protein
MTCGCSDTRIGLQFRDEGIEPMIVTSVISDTMRASEGSELGRFVSFPISESDIRRWAAAVYYPEPPPREFWDAEAAAETRYGGIVAPAEFNPFAWMVADPPGGSTVGLAGSDPDIVERQLGTEGPGLTRVLNGGMSVEYGLPMRPGDVITSVTRLGKYRESEGSLGPMLFTTQDTIWTNQRDQLVRTSQLTLIRY